MFGQEDLDIIKAGYNFVIDAGGYLWALTEGKHGYKKTQIFVDLGGSTSLKKSALKLLQVEIRDQIEVISEQGLSGDEESIMQNWVRTIDEILKR